MGSIVIVLLPSEVQLIMWGRLIWFLMSSVICVVLGQAFSLIFNLILAQIIETSVGFSMLSFTIHSFSVCRIIFLLSAVS